jgi:hypothetical protein
MASIIQYSSGADGSCKAAMLYLWAICPIGRDGMKLNERQPMPVA